MQPDGKQKHLQTNPHKQRSNIVLIFSRLQVASYNISFTCLVEYKHAPVGPTSWSSSVIEIH